GIIESASGAVGSASIEFPFSGVERDLTRRSPEYDHSYARSSPVAGGGYFETLPEFDAGFPNGTYVLRMATLNDGFHTIPVMLEGNLYPSVPLVSNFAEAQQIDP